MNWDDRQQAKRIESRRTEHTGVPADHFATAPQPRSRRQLRKARRAVRVAIAQRDGRSIWDRPL